jgi:molybdate transport system regulatory protein
MKADDAMIDLHLYLTIGPDTRIGHGKVLLLEAVAMAGSISAAARSLDMTYRRAWELIDHMNKAFGRPLVSGHAGSSGGAELTPLGRDVITRYRAIESEARSGAAPHIAALQAMIAERPADQAPKP